MPPRPPPYDASKVTQIAELAVLRTHISGILLPSDKAYEKERLLFNYDMSGCPACIIFPSSIKEVLLIMDFAKSNQYPLCIASGKHSVYSSVTNAIQMNMKELNHVMVDVEKNTVSCGAGVLLGELIEELSNFGVGFPTGSHSTVGLTGLTLGGGVGFLSRSLGMTLDSLLNVKIALIDGSVVDASEEENEDLFWALRGGGGNFGVVLELTFRLHTIGESGKVWCGSLNYSSAMLAKLFSDSTQTAVHRHADYYQKMPKEMGAISILTGDGEFVSNFVYNGKLEEGEHEIEILRDHATVGKPKKDTLSVMSYFEFLPNCAANVTQEGYLFERSIMMNFTDTQEEIDIVLSGQKTAPNAHCSILFTSLGGKMAEIATDSTAIFHRSPQLWIIISGSWNLPEERQEVVEWVISLENRLKPYSEGAYQTLGIAGGTETEDTEDRGNYEGWMSKGDTSVMFGSNLERLREVKKKFDPDNFFCFNRNIF